MNEGTSTQPALRAPLPLPTTFPLPGASIPLSLMAQQASALSVAQVTMTVVAGTRRGVHVCPGPCPLTHSSTGTEPGPVLRAGEREAGDGVGPGCSGLLLQGGRQMPTGSCHRGLRIRTWEVWGPSELTSGGTVVGGMGRGLQLNLEE